MSKLFKATNYSTSDEKIILTPKAPTILPMHAHLYGNKHPAIEGAEAEAQVIISDAEEIAQQIIREASEQARLVKEQAMLEIEQWWEEKRQEAFEHAQATHASACQEGLVQGVEEGKELALQEEQHNITQAHDVLEMAYQTKERIIAEAEPFLVELATQIAKKIVGDELSQSPEKVLEVARKALYRSRAHGQITLSVNHRYFDYMEEHRAQLVALLDGQADLGIYPDYSILDEGCVVRTPFGSVDARIDTQLTEIKQVLLDIARGSEGHGLS